MLRRNNEQATPPSGYLQWGLVHTWKPDFGTLAHVTKSQDVIYTGAVNGNKWEIRAWQPASARSEMVAAAADQQSAMKCFEVIGNNIFICFANGKMCVYDKTTQEQVRTWHASPEVVGTEGTPLGPIAQRSDAKKQVNTLLVTGSGAALKLWAGSMDGRVYVYDLSSQGELINVRSVAHDALKTGVRALATDGSLVYGGTEDGKLFTLQRDSEAFVASVKGHASIVSCLCRIGNLVWSGGHDSKICAIDGQCQVQYQVGDLKDDGTVAQPGGVKGIVQCGWNVWTFNSKTISIYTSHCISEELTTQMTKLQGTLGQRETALTQEQQAAQKLRVEMSDMANKMDRDGKKWEQLGQQQQDLLDKQSLEKDAALAKARAQGLEIERLQEEIESGKAGLGAESKLRADGLAALQLAQEEIKRLQQELQAKQAEADRQAAELLAKQAEADRQAAELQAKQAKVDRHAVELEAAQKSALEAQKALQSECAQLQETLAAQSQSNEAMVSQLHSEMANTRSQLDETTNVKDSKDASMTKMQSEFAELQRTISQQRREKDAELQIRNEKLLAAQADAARLQEETDAKVLQLTQQLEQAREGAKQRDGDGAKAQADLQAEHARLSEAFAQAEAQIAALHAAMEAAMLKEQAMQLSEESLTAQAAELAESMATLRANRDQLATELQEQQSVLSSTADSRAAELEKQRAEMALLETQLSGGKAEADKQTQRIRELEGSGQDAATQARALQLEIDRLKAAVDAAQAGAGTLRGERDALQFARDALEGDTAARADELAALASETQNKDKDLADMAAASQELGVLTDELAAAKAKLDSEVSQLGLEKAALAEKMQQQMLALQAERDALKETVAGVQASLEQLNVDREETLRTLGAAAGNAEGWKQKHDELTRLLAEQQAQHKASLLTATASNRSDSTIYRGVMPEAQEIVPSQPGHPDQRRQLDRVKKNISEELQEKLQFAQDTESTLKQVQQSKADLESTLSARSAEQLALQAAADQAASQLSETMSTVKRLESKVLQTQAQLADQQAKASQVAELKGQLSESRLRYDRDARQSDKHISELHAQLADARAQLTDVQHTGAQALQELQGELDSASQELDTLLEDKYQLQIALKAVQKQLASAPPAEAVAKMGQVEGALKQAVKDYHLLLKEMSTLSMDMKKKDGRARTLQKELDHALAQIDGYRMEQERMQSLMDQLEAQIDASRREAGSLRREAARARQYEPQPQQHSPPPPPHPEPEFEQPRKALDPPALLRGCRVVLVAPKSAANIGAAARACENFECFDLAVVAPRCDVRSTEALTIAVGSVVMEGLQVYDTLQEAVADMGAAVAFTRRTGKVRPVAASPSQLRGAYPELMQMLTTPPPPPLQATAQESAREFAGPESAQGEISVATSDEAVNAANGPSLGCALVFGREESGLTAQELSLCTHLCAIPTGRTKPSMNLSHAVSTVLATFFEHCSVARDGEDGVEEIPPNQWKILTPASLGEVESLMRRVSHIAGTLNLSSDMVINTSAGRKITEAGQFKHVCDRARLSVGEVRSLHTLFKRIGRELDLWE